MNTNSKIENMLGKKVWAVIGVSPNKEKFGYKIWKVLLDNHYEVYAINPKYDEIEGVRCYPSLKDLPVRPDVIDFVVPPRISIRAVEEAKELAIENLWFQPGSWDKEVLDKADLLGLTHVEDCVYAILK